MKRLFLSLAFLTVALAGLAQTNEITPDAVKDIIRRYDLEDRYGIYVHNDIGLQALMGRLMEMSVSNVHMTLSEMERRHLDNEALLTFVKKVKGKPMSDKWKKNLAAMLGGEQMDKAIQVITLAQMQEAYYPTATAAVASMKETIEKTLAERPFPEGKLLRLYYTQGGGMRGGRYMFNITRDKQGNYELETIRPGTPYDMTYFDESIAKYDVDEAFIQRIVETLKKHKVHQSAKDNHFFPGILFDAPSYTLSAKFEKGVIETRGDGTLPIADDWRKIVEEESK